MPQPATTEQSPPMTRREAEATLRRVQSKAGERTAHLSDGQRDRLADGISRELRAALNAIPSGSVTARTAGALRGSGPRLTIAEERAAFEQGVAEENARPTEG